MRDGLSDLAVSASDAFAELRGNGAGATPEAVALSAAVRLFASVFRLQTSEVRGQPLGLDHAATRVLALPR